jgi:hypothetical protein
MLPLKAPVNTLQNAVRYADCLVGAFAFLDRRLEHHDAGLVLENPPDRFNVEVPECRDLGRSVVPFGRSSPFQRNSQGRKVRRPSLSVPQITPSIRL